MDAEGYELNDDGTVTLHLGDGPRRLRRPKLGEFRRIREYQDRMAEHVDAHRDEALALRDELNAAATERADGGRPRLTADERARDRKASAVLNEAAESAVLGWLRLVCDGGDLDGYHLEGLSDLPLPEDDELPAWAASALLLQAITAHWQFAPPLSGAR